VRGEWIEHEDEMECPQCGYFWNYCDNDTERFNYCPNCGAKMESEGST
jgi:predicted amidophosphoribosyltransferase